MRLSEVKIKEHQTDFDSFNHRFPKMKKRKNLTK